MKDGVFFALAGLGFAAIAAIAMAPGLAPRGGPPDPAPGPGGWILLDAAALSAIDASKAHPAYPGPNRDRGQEGVRIAAAAPFAPGIGGAGAGAGLPLGPGAGEALAGRAVEAEIIARGVPATPTDRFMIGLSRGADVGWVEARAQPVFTRAMLRLPAPQGGDGPLTLRVWADPAGEARGVEIRSLALRPAS
jgi:hypothetical protein